MSLAFRLGLGLSPVPTNEEAIVLEIDRHGAALKGLESSVARLVERVAKLEAEIASLRKAEGAG